MKFLNFLDSKETLLRDFSNEIAGFYLFGSKARGDFNKKSDIDILSIRNIGDIEV